MGVKPARESQILPAWSDSTVLRLIDAVAITIAQGYMLARVRLTSHPSPVVRLAAARDAMAWDGALLKRELAVFRQERERLTAKQRPHYTAKWLRTYLGLLSIGRTKGSMV